MFDLTYACMCKYPRGSKLNSSNVIRRGEVRWLHNVQFCLKSKVSLGHRGRSRSPVSCARNAANDEDLQLGYVVRSAAIEFRLANQSLSALRVSKPVKTHNFETAMPVYHRVQPKQGCHIVESRHRLGLSLIGAYQNCFVQVQVVWLVSKQQNELNRPETWRGV